MDKVEQNEVLSRDQGLRLDRWFKQYFPQVSHGMLEKWLRKGNVRVNGKRAKANYRVQTGDFVRIPPLLIGGLGLEKPKRKARPQKFTPEQVEQIKGWVLYEDDQLYVLNKPTGVAVQGGTKVKHSIDQWIKALVSDDEEMPRLVHRIDKDTSGLLIIAKTRKSAQWLSKAFKEKRIEKTYWAIVRGVPTPLEGTIDYPIAKISEKGVEKMRFSQGDENLVYQKAITHFRTLEYAAKKFAWLELQPETGRTHQLRLHCKALKTPVLGDKKYGGEWAQPFDELVPLHLHAVELTIPYPGGQKKKFEAPLHDHMQTTMDRLGFNQ